MCTAPHYIKPEQDGLYQHFLQINEACNLPLMLYVHPGRTGCVFTSETIYKIMNLDNFIALKDASNDIENPLNLVIKNVNFLTGDDFRILAYSANGGSGCVSVISNIFPRICNKINSYIDNNDYLNARKLMVSLAPLLEAIFKESNPIGIKFAAYFLGYCRNEIISPLTWSNNIQAKKIQDEVLKLKNLEEDV